MDTFGDITTPGQGDESVAAGRRSSRIIPLAIVGAIVICISIVVFQRFGTIANATIVETTRNLDGGFLAVGMTEEQPGFILVSALDQKDVSIDTRRSINKLTGTHTNVYVDTTTQHWKTRLRKPLVITIGDDGSIQSSTVDWSLHTFHLVQDAVDCSHPPHQGHHASSTQKQCGVPFLDLKKRVEKWPTDSVPNCLSEFLASR